MKRLSKLTIGIDLRPLQGLHRYRGVGVHIRRLVKAISELGTTNTFILYMVEPYHKVLADLELSPKFKYEVRTVPMRVRNETIYKFIASWRTLAPLDYSRVDVLLQPDIAFGVAPQHIPTVGVFYDSIPMIYRAHHLDRGIIKVAKAEGLKAALAYVMNKRVYLQGIRRYKLCTHLLAISDSSKKDLLSMIDYSEAKVTVTPLAATEEYHVYSEAESASILGKLNIPKPYVLYIGGADYRKNVVDAIDAFRKAHAKQSNLTLVLVGRDFDAERLRLNHTLHQQISSLGNAVVCVGYGKEEDLPKLYAGAKAFLFPSMYEGFGIPVLEAMKSCCPVVAYANSSIPEIVQGSFELARTKEQYRELLLRVVTDSTYVAKSTRRAEIVATEFSWENTAKMTLDSLNKVIHEDTR